ncbi:hypothetical protein [Pseudomonas anguilliseptica]|uniref:hypothetical protein n=1 Tax=Pseudomonas anguilliseptica TaxID=53406 RepID=UPI0022AF1B1A|nr:hypothetical protein [Pseudomonas anguilliseptica]MCZ4324660.1 hypothetical protein [Pseudomonas anguilliseptica]
MPNIDPARLSRVLASLSKPSERVNSSVAKGTEKKASESARKGERSSAVLRARLRERLINLKKASANFHEAAPIVAVQEILLWEFGEGILERAEFESVAKKVAETMLEDKQLATAISRIIDALISASKN